MTPDPFPHAFPWTRDEHLAHLASVPDSPAALCDDPAACWISRAIWVGIVAAGLVAGAGVVLTVRRWLQ